MEEALRTAREDRASSLAGSTRLQERLRELERELAGARAPSVEPPAEPSFTGAATEEEPDRPDETNPDEAEGVYDRIEDVRAQRSELDRERSDREEEFGRQSFWLICPKCGESLEEYEEENIKMERCDACGGLYLDRGEAELLHSLMGETGGLQRIRNILRF
jgi:hypothetical protein